MGIAERAPSGRQLVEHRRLVADLVAGLLELVFGLVLVFFPVSGILSIVWLIGVFALLFGLVLVVSAFTVRSEAKKAGVL